MRKTLMIIGGALLVMALVVAANTAAINWNEGMLRGGHLLAARYAGTDVAVALGFLVGAIFWTLKKRVASLGAYALTGLFVLQSVLNMAGQEAGGRLGAQKSAEFNVGTRLKAAQVATDLRNNAATASQKLSSGRYSKERRAGAAQLVELAKTAPVQAVEVTAKEIVPDGQAAMLAALAEGWGSKMSVEEIAATMSVLAALVQIAVKWFCSSFGWMVFYAGASIPRRVVETAAPVDMPAEATAHKTAPPQETQVMQRYNPLVEQFIEQCCVEDDNEQIIASELCAAFNGWADANLAASTFGTILSRHLNIKSTPIARGKAYALRVLPNGVPYKDIGSHVETRALN